MKLFTLIFLFISSFALSQAVYTYNGDVLTYGGDVVIYPTAPGGIEDLKSWYDFTDTLNMTRSGDTISQLNDKSITANHGTASGALRPLYVADQINGLGVGRFYHANALNTLTTASTAYGASYTIFVVSSADFSMGTIMGDNINNAILTNQEPWNFRTPTAVIGCGMYYYSSAHVGDEYSFYTLRSNAGTATYWERKNLRSYYYLAGSSLGSSTLKDIGGWVTYPYKKDIAEIIIYDRSLSDLEIVLVQEYITAKYGLSSFTANPANRITFTGNSITENPYYPSVVFTNLNTDGSWIPTRYASGGSKVNQLYPIASLSWLLTQRTQTPVTGNDIVVCWGGTNDLYAGETAIETESRINTWCTYYKNAGFKVVILTILPRTEAGGFTEAKRLDANDLIRANYTGYADAIADVGADALMGQEFDNENTTYYWDGVHPKDAGYDRLVEEWIQPAINSILE